MLTITIAVKSANTKAKPTTNVEFLNTLLSDLNEYSTSQPTMKSSELAISEEEFLETIKNLLKD